MSVATVTSKGQITIPKDIRKLLKIDTGDKLEIIISQQGKATIRPITRNIDDIFGKLHNSNQKPISVEEMNEAIKTKLKKRFK